MHQPSQPFASAEQIESALRAFVVRWRWRMLLRRTAQALVIFLGGLLIVAIFHRVIGLPSLLRELACDGLFGVALSRLMPALARLLRRDADLVRAAVLIERRQPALEQRLSTWMSCRTRGEASPLMTRLDQKLRFELRHEQIDASLPRWPIGLVVVVLAVVLLSLTTDRFIGPVLPPWR